MKSHTHLYPQLRRDFESVEELCNVINKKRSSVLNRLNGRQDFTYNEMKLIAVYLGEDVSKAREICRKE